MEVCSIYIQVFAISLLFAIVNWAANAKKCIYSLDKI